MSHDPKTEAAIQHLLKGKGPSRSGLYLVTVHGGQIVSVATVDNKIPAEQLAASPKPEHRTVANLRDGEQRPK